VLVKNDQKIIQKKEEYDLRQKKNEEKREYFKLNKLKETEMKR